MSALRGARVVLRGGQRPAKARRNSVARFTQSCASVGDVHSDGTEADAVPQRRRAYERPVAQAARNGRAGPGVLAGPQDGRSRRRTRAGVARGVDPTRGGAGVAATRGAGDGALDEHAPQDVAASAAEQAPALSAGSGGGGGEGERGA